MRGLPLTHEIASAEIVPSDASAVGTRGAIDVDS
jgi:hypothetical protein